MGEKLKNRLVKTFLIFLVVAVVVLTPILLSACGKKAKVQVVNIKLTSEEYAFCVNRTDSAMLSRINDFLIEVKSNGTFNKIVAKYFGKGTPQGVKSAPQNSENALVVVTCADFPPFEYMDGDTYYGVDMELAAAFAKKLGRKLVIKNVVFESIFYELQMGHADVAISAVSVVEARKNLVTFSNSYYVAGQVILTRAGDNTFANCSTAEDIKNVLRGMNENVCFGYQYGTSAYYFIFGKSGEYAEVFPVTGEGFDSVTDAVNAMLNGEVDYVMLDSAVASAIAEMYNSKKK